MINIDCHQTVGGTFGASKFKWIDRQTVQQSCHPHFLTVRFIKHKIAVQVTHSHRAREIWVGNLGKHVSDFVVNVAVRIASKEKLSAVVSDRHGARAGHSANQSRRGSHAVEFVDFVAGYHKYV